MSKQQADDFHLHESDVRAMTRLLGEVCVLSGDLADKRRHLMDGLCRLVDADAWVWDLATRMAPGQRPVYASLQHGGFSDSEFSSFLTLLSQPEQAELTAPYAAELNQAQGQLTRTIQQIIPPEADWQGPIAQAWRECGFFAVCVSFLPVEDGCYSGIGLYRRWDRPLFDAREALITHIVMSEVKWLHERTPVPTAKINALSPRLWLVNESLLQGFSRKRIASDLGISLNTVNGYVNELFQHFSVRSHAELMHRFFSGSTR